MLNESDIKQFCKDIGYSRIKRAGLANTVKAYYLGMDLSYENYEDFDEVANELDLSSKECTYWENLFYRKDSWLNKE